MRKGRIRNYLGRNFKKKKENDKISSKRRSLLMSKILSKSTKFENEFLALLKESTKTRYALNVNKIKGKPDIVFARKKICVFLDSDFWHGWQYPRWKHLLKNNFWKEKISNNRKRDIRNTTYLRKNGWKVIRIWEHQVKTNPGRTINQILSGLKDL